MAAFSLPEMETAEFAQWQTLLEEKTGLWLPENRKSFLTASLSKHMKALGIADYRELYDKLNAGAISALDWAAIIDSLTVHETCFYRDEKAIAEVVAHCKEAVIKRAEHAPGKAQHVQVWSVGCATGEEAYTLAIELHLMQQQLRQSRGITAYYGVVGMDISYPSLAVAREGIYNGKQVATISAERRRQFFNQLPDNHFQIKDVIRQRTCFVQGNVLDLEHKLKQPFDAIFCQNLLIYFRQQKKWHVVKQLSQRLKPGGMLVLGHGEITTFDTDILTRIENKQCLAFLRKS